MEKRRLAGKLTPRNRPLEDHLAGLGFDEGTIATTLPWSNKLLADAQRWLARVGFASDGRWLSKRDAGRALRCELAKLEGGAG